MLTLKTSSMSRIKAFLRQYCIGLSCSYDERYKRVSAGELWSEKLTRASTHRALAPPPQLGIFLF